MADPRDGRRSRRHPLTPMSRDMLVLDPQDPVVEAWQRMQDLSTELAVVCEATRVVAVVSQRPLAVTIRRVVSTRTRWGCALVAPRVGVGDRSVWGGALAGRDQHAPGPAGVGALAFPAAL